MLDWKNVAVKSLKNYKPMEVALFCLSSEIEEIEWDMKKTQKAVMDGLSVDSVKDIQLSRRIMLLKLEYRLKYTQKALEDIKQALLMLTEEDRTILSDFFVSNEGKSMEEMARDLGYSLATMYRKKDSALWNFAVNLHGINMEK